MVAVPFYYILFVFGFFLLTFITFALVNIAHLVRTGTFTVASFLVTFLFLSGTAIIVWFTVYLLQNVGWTQTVPVWNGDWIKNFLSPDQAIF